MPPRMSESHMGYNLKGAEWTAEERGHAEIAPPPPFPLLLNALLNTSCLLFPTSSKRSVSGSNKETKRGIAAKNGPQWRVASGGDVQPGIANCVVENSTKNYRRTELSRISPSVIYGLSDPREHGFSLCW